MERILTIGPIEWESVAIENSNDFLGRDVDSIPRKYISLHRKKIPTGDLNIPMEVRMTKRVKYKIGDKAKLDDTTIKYDMLGYIPKLQVP